MPIRLTSLLLAVGMILTACAATEDNATGGPTGVPTDTTATSERGEEVTLTLVTHDSFAAGVTDETFSPFVEATGVEVEVFPAGDAGAILNQAILTKDDPIGDVLFGVDDTFLSRALAEDIFAVYESQALVDVPDELELDSEHRVTPIDFGDVCLNYDRAAFTDIAPPSSLADLTDPAYAGATVVENPATSSPGLAFLLATVAEFGEDGWQDYWRSLVDNDVAVAPDWDTAYYAEFSRYGGDHPIVVSYASSPPAEVIFAEEPLDEAPTGIVEDGCYRQIEFVGILAGTPHEAESAALVDFMLSPGFQESIPLTWFVFPANQTAALPDEFIEHTVVPAAPAAVDPDTIDANRERWIEEWTEIVLP
jgi:thiamine transport system substrate-binding protein